MGRRVVIAALAALAAALAAGCAQPHSDVAVVNVETLERSWPKFINYYNQLQANLQAIQQSKVSDAEKKRQFDQLQQQSKRWQDEVTQEVRSAVKDIALQRNYKLVVTRQGVAFGGDDITSDVEKALKIALPSPSPGG